MISFFIPQALLVLVVLGTHRRVHVWPRIKDVLLHHAAHLVFLPQLVHLLDKVPSRLDGRIKSACQGCDGDAEKIKLSRNILSLPEVEAKSRQRE